MGPGEGAVEVDTIEDIEDRVGNIEELEQQRQLYLRANQKR